MKKIKVLQVVTRLVVGGAPRHVVQLARGLDPGRFEVELLAGREAPGESPIWQDVAALGLKATRIESLGRPVRPWQDAAAYRAIGRHLRAGGYDIVHTHISKAGLLGRLAARRAGVPAVLHTYHGVVGELRGGSLGSRLLRRAERVAAASADALVAVSAQAVDELLAVGIGRPEQYRVVGNAIDTEYFVPRPPSADLPVPAGHRPLVGVVGRLGPEKGVEVLIEAFAKLRRRWPQALLCIVGDGPERPALEALAGRLGLVDGVHFAGNIADVRPWLASMDAVVLPSRSEGLSASALEALALARPLVATDVGGIPAVVLHGQTGLLVPPGDATALAEGIGTLLADTAAAREMGAAGRRLVAEQYSLPGMVAAIAALYEELAGRGR